MAQTRRQTILLLLGFCLAVAATFFFGYRAGRTSRRIRWQNEPIRPWMSVPFIAHVHHTRSEPLFQAIGVPPDPRDRRPIRDIARTEKRPVADLIRNLDKALAEAGQSGQAP